MAASQPQALVGATMREVNDGRTLPDAGDVKRWA